MTRRGERRPRGRGALLHVPGMLGRLRTDAGAVIGTMCVVVLATGIAAVVPRLIEETADKTARYAVASAGDEGEVSAFRPLGGSAWQERRLEPHLADTVAEEARQVTEDLGPVLASVLTDPVTTVSTSALLPITPILKGLVSLRGFYLGPDGPDIEWVSGGPAGSTLTVAQAEKLDDGDVWHVEAALSVGVADALDAAVGDTISLRNENKTVFVDLTVSGIFRAVDPTAPGWPETGGLLTPRSVGSALTAHVQVGVLLSAQSLPVAVRAMPAGTTFSTVTFSPVPEAFDAASLDAVVAEIAGVKAQAVSENAAAGYYGVTNGITTDLDAVLRAASERIRAGTAQAWLVLAGVLAMLGLVLLLTARLLLRRRSDVLTTYRARGATAPGLATELAIESLLVTAVGTWLGVAAAGAVVPGPVPWPWVLPVAALAAAAPPTVAVWQVVRRSGGRRTAANRHDRRVLDRDRTAARWVAEAALVLAAVGAVAALRTRRVGSTGPDALLALTPSLAAVAAAVALAHLVPVLLRASLRWSRRSRRLVGMLAAARAHASGTAVLPFVALSVATALSGLSFCVAATVVSGQEDASWSAVGADAVAVTDPDPALVTIATELGAAPGVSAAPGVVDEGQLFGRWGTSLVRVVALSAQRYAQLLENTPLPDAPDLARLAGTEGSTPDATVPVLLSTGLDAGSEALSLLWDDMSVDLTAVGVAPDLFGDGDTVVVDADAFGKVTGTVPAPDRLWLAGPDVAQSAAALPALAGAQVQTRAAWLATLRADPLTVALLRLDWAAAGLLAVLGALALALVAATTAPQRARTLAMVRTLGLDPRAERRVTAGEMLPGVLVAVLGGVAVGVLLARLVILPLGLDLVTTQAAGPRLVVPLWVGVPAALVVVTVAMLVELESLRHRREILGGVLRVGG